MTFVRWLHEYDPADRARLGGKNASLGELLAAGLPVPPGFAVTIDAYQTLRRHADLRRAVGRLLAEVDLGDAGALEEISAAIRRRIELVPLDDGVAEAVRRAYQALCEHCASGAVPVAVRSSASSEDLPDASFAGEHDTFLWVRGPDDVLRHVSRCWSSLFTARAIAYRHETGHDHEVVAMSVGVQKMVRPKASGVAFTLNPSWAPIFGKIKATVTDVGGMMAHAAIVCREYGLPAVTGTAFGTKTIKNGQRIRVDGNNGTVDLLD